MRVAPAIAAMVSALVIGAPTIALADEPAPTPVPGIPGPGVNVPPPTPAPAPAPQPAPAPPGDTAPKTDPAYGDYNNPDVRDFPAPKGKDVIVVAYPERSKRNIITLGGMAAGGLILGAVGLYYHLDSRSAADEVGAHSFSGEPWTADKQAAYERAHSSSVTAGVFYGIGGALLIATAITYIVTEPEAETMVIHPHTDPKPTALVAPIKGGAVVGGAWRF
jgi:hypothetical protein